MAEVEVDKKSDERLYRELKNILSTVSLSTYVKDKVWRRDLLLMDLELIQAHRRHAGAPDPPSLDLKKELPELVGHTLGRAGSRPAGLSREEPDSRGAKRPISPSRRPPVAAAPRDRQPLPPRRAPLAGVTDSGRKAPWAPPSKLTPQEPSEPPPGREMTARPADSRPLPARGREPPPVARRILHAPASQARAGSAIGARPNAAKPGAPPRSATAPPARTGYSSSRAPGTASTAPNSRIPAPRTPPGDPGRPLSSRPPPRRAPAPSGAPSGRTSSPSGAGSASSTGPSMYQRLASTPSGIASGKKPIGSSSSNGTAMRRAASDRPSDEPPPKRARPLGSVGSAGGVVRPSSAAPPAPARAPSRPGSAAPTPVSRKAPPATSRPGSAPSARPAVARPTPKTSARPSAVVAAAGKTARPGDLIRSLL